MCSMEMPVGDMLNHKNVGSQKSPLDKERLKAPVSDLLVKCHNHLAIGVKTWEVLPLSCPTCINFSEFILGYTCT